jgi:hypothetical protein
MAWPCWANLLVEATRLIVFAGFLWAAGDIAVLLIESNHDLRASRILLGRLNGRMDRFLDDAESDDRSAPPGAGRDGPGAPPRAGPEAP